MLFIGHWYMGTKVLIMVTGNIRVLRSESLILVNISNKAQVQKPWPCFLNVSVQLFLPTVPGGGARWTFSSSSPSSPSHH